MADQEGALRAALVLVQRVLRVEDRRVAQDVEVDRRTGNFPLLLAELLPARHQALRQVVGDVEREVASHDGHARRGRERAGCLRACDDCELFEKLVLTGQLFVMTNVRFCEGNRVAPICVDRDVVAADEDRHDGNDSFLSEFLDLVPRQSDGIFHDVIETLVHCHNERLQIIARRGVYFSGGRADSGFLGMAVCVSEVTHDRAHSVAVDVDDPDRGKAGERSLRVSSLR